MFWKQDLASRWGLTADFSLYESQISTSYIESLCCPRARSWGIGGHWRPVNLGGLFIPSVSQGMCKPLGWLWDELSLWFFSIEKDRDGGCKCLLVVRWHAFLDCSTEGKYIGCFIIVFACLFSFFQIYTTGLDERLLGCTWKYLSHD